MSSVWLSRTLPHPIMSELADASGKSVPDTVAVATSLRSQYKQGPLTRIPPPLYKLRPCPSYSRRRDCNNCVRNFNCVRYVVRPQKTWVW